MEYFQLICVLIGVIGLIIALLWALRKLNKGVIVSGGKRLKIIDRAILGGEKSVVVVSVSGRCMLLGVTSHRIEKIADLDMTEEEYLSALYPAAVNGEKSGFFSAFTAAVRNNAGKKRTSRSETDDYAEERPAVGTPAEGTFAEGTPAEGTFAEGRPAEGTFAEGKTADDPAAKGSESDRTEDGEASK